MTKPTVKQLFEALEDQRVASESRIEQLEQKLTAQIEAAKPKAHIGYWISGFSATFALCSASVALVALIFNTQQQAETGRKQAEVLAAQQQQASALTKQGEAIASQALGIRQMGCSMIANQAVSDMRANPQAANRIFDAMADIDTSCKTVGVPVLARTAYLIDENPTNIPLEITKRASQALAALPTRDRSTLFRDKLEYDQAKLRQFYHTQGYADFRVVSAINELTPDKRDFIIQSGVIGEGIDYFERSKAANEEKTSERLEKTPTSELRLSAGFTSLEKFMMNPFIMQRRFIRSYPAS
jgi:hypothetical protein